MLRRRNLNILFIFMSAGLILVSGAFILSIPADAEHVTINSTHSDTPLAYDVGFEVEIDENGEWVFVSHLWQGITMMNTVTNEVRHLNSTNDPPLPNEAIRAIHYSSGMLFIAISDTPSYTLDIYVLYINNMTLRLLDDDLDVGLDAPLFYYPPSRNLFIGGSTGLYLLNIDNGTTWNRFTPQNGLYADSVTYFQYEPLGPSIYVGTTSFSGHGIHRLDLTTNQIDRADEIIMSGVASSSNVNIGTLDLTNLLSFYYDINTEHLFVSFDEIYDPDTFEIGHMGFIDRAGANVLEMLNTSFYQYIDYGDGLEPIIFDGIEIYNILPIRNGEVLLISLGDIGAGLVYTSNNTFKPVMSRYPESPGMEPYFIPSFPGSFDVSYDPSRDMAYYPFSGGLGIFDPDEPFWVSTSGPGPDDDITVDDDIEYDPDRSNADKIEDLIYISLYTEGKDGEEEEEYDDDHVIGPDDYIWASAGAWDIPNSENLSYMKIFVIESLSGEVVMEQEGDGFWVNMEISGEDLASSRYIIRVEGVNDQGDILFYGERDIYVENPTTVPIIGAIAGATVGVVGGVGAGILVSSMSGTFSAGASTTASSTSSFSWKNLLFGLATEYTEEQLRERTGKKKKIKWELEQFITWKEVLTMLVAVVFMVIAFGYVEMMGLLAPHDGIFIGKVGIFAFPEFGIIPFLVVLPIVIFTSVVIILTIEMVEELAAKLLGLSSEMTLWPIGLITLIISGLLLMPFGYPAKTILKGKGKVDENKEALIASLVLFTMMALLFPFGLIYLIGFLLRGSAFPDLLLATGTVGLSICTMMLLAASLPFRPMEGQKIWKFNRSGLITTLIVGLFLFWMWNFRLVIVPPIWSNAFIYIPGWMSAITLTFFGFTSLLMVGLLVLIGGKMSGRANWPDVKIPKIYLFEDEEE